MTIKQKYVNIYADKEQRRKIMKIRIIAITKDPELKSAEKTLENWKENYGNVINIEKEPFGKEFVEVAQLPEKPEFKITAIVTDKNWEEMDYGKENDKGWEKRVAEILKDIKSNYKGYYAVSLYCTAF